MKVLILDKGTFVGRKIIEKFLKLGHDVCVIDDGNRMPIEEAKYIIVDRNDSAQVITKLKDAEFDVVIDVATEFVEQTKTIVSSLIARVRHFIQISSAVVYKENDCYPITEDLPRGYNPNWWNSSRHKYLSEEFLFKTYSENKFPVTILRPFYVYGAGNDLYQENYIFQRLIQKMPIMVPANGQTMVQFGHVSDLANVVIKIMLNENTFGQAYNVSGKEWVSFKQWINICAEVVDIEPKVHFINSKACIYTAKDFFPLKDAHLFGSTDKLSKLGIEPEFTLLEGLRQTYENIPKRILQVHPIQTKQERDISIWKMKGLI